MGKKNQRIIVIDPLDFAWIFLGPSCLSKVTI